MVWFVDMPVNNNRLYSCEFFPPRTDDATENLHQVSEKLAVLNLKFFSVTFGAGGSTREKTFETAVEIQQRTHIETAPHISCIGSTRGDLKAVLQNYFDHGVKRIVALRGDVPSGTRSMGDFRYASELVEFIREEFGDHFCIEVAAYPEVHPQAPNATADIVNFKRKIDAGANSAITQYFYNTDAYFYFVDACHKQGIEVPIVPGIMPITNYSQLSRFSEACGAEIPRWIRKRLEYYGDDRASIRQFGVEVVSEMCRKLLDQGAPGLHFYTMNQARATLAIWEDLKLHCH